MKTARIPENESQRIQKLYEFDVLDTPAEKDYDDIVKLASAICGTPISLVSLIDCDRQWFKSSVGIDTIETKRDVAFCSHVILEDDLMVVENTLADERFHDNPLVTGDPNIRFYAGAPLVTTDGFKLGTLCVIDREPRKLNENQKFALKILSKQVIKNLELRLQNKELQRLVALKAKFLSIITHDLRQPLRGLKSLISLFEEDEINQQTFQIHRRKLGFQVDLVEELLDDLLLWAKNFQHDKINKSWIPVKKLHNKCEELFAEQAECKGNKLIFEIDENLDVWADPDMLRMVMRNLISNAIKFTENGTIQVSVKLLQDGGVYFQVKDSGVGISTEHIHKILSTSDRHTMSGTRNEKGSGMGLWLVKESLTIHQSALKVESTPGKGSSFGFVLAPQL